MFTLYSSKDKVNFEFEEQHKTLPEIVQALGKWLSIRSMNLDPNIGKDNKWPNPIKETWYIFEGKNNIDGRLVGSAAIDIKRFDK